LRRESYPTGLSALSWTAINVDIHRQLYIGILILLILNMYEDNWFCLGECLVLFIVIMLYEANCLLTMRNKELQYIHSYF
jgi:hypothetical protein